MLEHDYQLPRRALTWTHGFGRKDRPFGSTEVDFVIDLAGGSPLEEESVRPHEGSGGEGRVAAVDLLVRGDGRRFVR